MKKIKKILVILMCLIVLCSCNLINNQSRDTYTVTFLNYDNSLLCRATGIEEGTPAIYDGPTPTRPDTSEYSYIFVGWDKDIKAVYSDMTVFAKYETVQKDENSSTVVGGLQLKKYQSTIVPTHVDDFSDIVSYRDDNYYYFVFDLGVFYNIPVNSAYYKYNYPGSGTLSDSVTASSASTNMIQSSSNHAIQETTSFSSTKNLDITIHAGYDAPSSTGGWEGSLNVEAGYSRTKGDSELESWTESYSEVAEYSCSESRTTTITLKPGDLPGNYYYYLSIDIQVYGTIIKNIRNGEFFVTTNSSVIGRGFNFTHCGNDYLKFSCDDVLDFDYTDIIDKFDLQNVVPSNYYGVETEGDGRIHISDSPEALYRALNSATPNDVIVLDTDIDCENFPWPPIENFKGTLLGNGKKIKNIKYEIQNTNPSNVYYGLFKKLSGKISNVIFENLYIHVWNFHTRAEYLYVGGLCAILEGEISYVTINANSHIYGYNDDNENGKMHAYVGGFCGQINSGMISNCVIENAVVNGKSHVDTEKNDTGDCWSYTGGFVGYQNGGSIIDCTRKNNAQVISETVSAGKSSAFHCFAGGIVGYKVAGTITGCISSGTGLNTILDHHDNGYANSSENKKGDMFGNQ